MTPIKFCAWTVGLGLMSFQSSAEVHYQIDLTQGTQQLARVSASFPETPAGQLTLNIPSWRTGKYTIMPVAEGIRRVSITDEQGQPLSWDRSASGEWVVNLPKATKVKVSYQLHADELGVRLRHIDDSHAFLDASGVFVYSPSYRDDSVRVQLQVPKGWQSHSGMDSGDTPHSFVAPNYDVLIDSPIETGVSQSYQWKLDGRDYELVIWGEGNYNAEQMVEDLKKLSPTATAIWDDYPYKRYVYMVHATSGARGATEHLNSTIIQRPRFRFGSREDYLAFISTASHEFIHTWNVKAYRPEALVPYDYQNEAISDLLWISEGSTSYFQRQLLLRGDIISFDEFSKDLARRIDAHLNTPGRQVQSVAEASRGQWIRRHDHFAHNHSVNIYSEGYLASLLLDFDMLKTSNLKRSYRDLHRVLYRDYSTPKSFNRNDVLKILSELQGRDYSNWWQAHIESPMQPDFFELMALAGLSLNYPRGTKDVVSADLTLKAGDRAVVDKVDREGVAWKAGLTHGDEIVAINGLKVAGGDWSKRLQDFKAGDQLTLSYFRRDRLQETQIILSSKKDKPLTLTMMDKPSKQQKAFFKAWLGLSWEEAIASNKKVFW